MAHRRAPPARPSPPAARPPSEASVPNVRCPIGIVQDLFLRCSYSVCGPAKDIELVGSNDRTTLNMFIAHAESVEAVAIHLVHHSLSPHIYIYIYICIYLFSSVHKYVYIYIYIYTHVQRTHS